MELPENTTVYIGGKVFKKKIPNHFEDHLPENVKRKIPESKKPQKREKKDKKEKNGNGSSE
jgi:hypothetical protein